jgi:hypothetical protein
MDETVEKCYEQAVSLMEDYGEDDQCCMIRELCDRLQQHSEYLMKKEYMLI